MVEKLSATISIFRLEYDHLCHKVELYLIHELKCLRPIRMAILLFYLLQSGQQISILQATLLQAHDFYDLFELINLILSLEQSHSRHEIMENTPQSPHIHRFPVKPRPKQQLRRPVKQSPDHVGHLPPHEIQLLSHSVIDDLDMIIVGVDICGVWLRDKVTFLGNKHDVGRLEISMNDLIPMKFLDAPQDLLKNLLYCELFLAHDYFIQVYSQPLHHHHWLIFAYKRVNHPHQVFSTQDLGDIPLSDETNGQTNLIQCFEFFDGHYFLRLDVAALVDCAVGAFFDALEDRILFFEGVRLHKGDYMVMIYQSLRYIKLAIIHNVRRDDKKGKKERQGLKLAPNFQ